MSAESVRAKIAAARRRELIAARAARLEIREAAARGVSVARLRQDGREALAAVVEAAGAKELG